ncbi:MAG: hypothetical protein M5U28_35655 [Sandaracinaceae bacterium]|nr:hypothetical protein [Sandaracinaceae bacterium]
MTQRTGVTYPDAVERVLARALEREPGKRHATAGELVSELRAAIGESGVGAGVALKPASVDIELDEGAGAGVEVEPSGSFARSASERKRRGALYAAVALGAVVLLGAGGWLALRDPAASASGVERPPSPVAPEAPVEPELALPRAAEAPLARRPRARDPEPAEAPAAPVAEEPPEVAEALAPRRGTRRRPPRTAPQQGSPPSAPPASPAASEPAPETTRDTARATELATEGQRALLGGQLPRAASLYRQATQADPSYAPAWRSLGLAEERMGHAPEAARLPALPAARAERQRRGDGAPALGGARDRVRPT